MEESRSCSAPRRGSLVGTRVEIRGDLERRERMADDDGIFLFFLVWVIFWCVIGGHCLFVCKLVQMMVVTCCYYSDTSY